MDFFERWKRESRLLKKPGILLCFGFGALAALLCILACGSDQLYLLTLHRQRLPSAFFLALWFLLWSGGCAFCAGIFWFGTADCKSRRHGVLLCCFALLFTLFFYIAFVKAMSFIFALFMLLWVVVLQVFALWEAFRLSAVLMVAQILGLLVSLLFLRYIFVAIFLK